MDNKDISVVLGTHNRKKFLARALESIRREMESSQLSYEIIVIDGGSTDGTLKWLTKQKDVISIVQHNRGTWNGREIPRRSWGYFMNLGFKIAQGRYTCMLSDDCLVIPGAIKKGYQLFEDKREIGEKIGGIAFFWRNWPEQKNYMVNETLGDKMFVNHGIYLTQALKDVEYIDEDTYNFYGADCDLCLKLWDIGYLVTDSPESYIEHYGHANRVLRQNNIAFSQNDTEKLIKKWAGKYPPLKNNAVVLPIEKEYIDRLKTENIFKFLDPIYYVYYKSKKLILPIIRNRRMKA